MSDQRTGIRAVQIRDCASLHPGSQGRLVDDTLLAHLSPAQSETIGLIGTITVDIDHELAQLDPTGHRALRKPSVATPVP